MSHIFVSLWHSKLQITLLYPHRKETVSTKEAHSSSISSKHVIIANVTKSLNVARQNVFQD